MYWQVRRTGGGVREDELHGAKNTAGSASAAAGSGAERRMVEYRAVHVSRDAHAAPPFRQRRPPAAAAEGPHARAPAAVRQVRRSA